MNNGACTHNFDIRKLAPWEIMLIVVWLSFDFSSYRLKHKILPKEKTIDDNVFINVEWQLEQQFWHVSSQVLILIAQDTYSASRQYFISIPLPLATYAFSSRKI